MSLIEFSPSPYSTFMHQANICLDNGIQLHTEVGGNPEHPCILLIMGLGAQMIHWPTEFCKALIDQGFYVIRFDNRDVGKSSPHHPPSTLKHQHLLPKMLRFQMGLKNAGAVYSLEDMANDCANLMKKLQIHHYNVLGASMGGMIAQILAAKYPKHVTKIGLLFTSNNQAFLSPPKPKALLALLRSPKSEQEYDIIKYNMRLYQNIGSPYHTNIEELEQLADLTYQRGYTRMGILHQFLAILCTGSLKKWDKQIKQSTLVVHGLQDTLLPPSHGKAVAQAISDAQFKLIQGMGHDITSHFIPQLSGLFGHHFKF